MLRSCNRGRDKQVRKYEGFHWFNSPCQLLNRLEYRPTQLIRLSAIQSPVEGSTNVSTSKPQFDITLSARILQTLVNDRPTATHWLTLIVGRRAPTEPKTAFAGVMLDASFAIFRSFMASFNIVETPSRPFGSRGLGSIVESRCGCGEMASREGYEGEPEP